MFIVQWLVLHGFLSVVANRALIPRFATTGITPWQSALLSLAIHSTIIFFCALKATVSHGPQFTFERGLPQQCEIPYQPFTSTVPLFGAPYLFDAEFNKYYRYLYAADY
jgi:hypothetical protein